MGLEIDPQLVLLLVAEQVPTDPEGYELAAGLVPLLELLTKTNAAGRGLRLALAFEPALLEAFASAGWMRQFEAWCAAGGKRAVAMAEHSDRRGEQQQGYVARYEAARLRHVALVARQLADEQILTALQRCWRLGQLEVLAAVAPGPLAVQLPLARAAVAHQLGIWPAVVWLPGCRFDPAELPILARSGAAAVVLDPTGLRVAVPSGVPLAFADSGLTGLVRDPALAALISSTDLGYPGDPLFASQRRDRRSGLRLWRHATEPADALYDPYPAMHRAAEHATHFAASVTATLGQSATTLVAIDIWNLVGSWAEGLVWLRALAMLDPTARPWRFGLPSELVQPPHPISAVQLGPGSWD